MLIRLAIFLLLFLLLDACGEQNEGTKIFLYPGTKKVQTIVQYEDGRRNGAHKEYYKSGQLKMIRYYVNDTLRDSTIWYYENGNLQTIQILIRGKKERCWKNYNKSGQVISESHYEDDRLHGEVVKYSYKSRKVLKRYRYQRGRLDGKQEVFYNNGTKKSVTYYKAGQPLPGTEEWDGAGNPINNSFKIYVQEQNRVKMENKLRFLLRLENPQESDEVYRVQYNPNNKQEWRSKVLLRNGFYELEFSVFPGDYVMENVKIEATRKSGMGNTLFSSTSFNAAANNY
ncbi:MAG: hypothetical protein IT233_03060 [Bacteroidia bacterium]|nr:hypothetical protein [Bacteroidia bacterium]